MRAPDRVRRRSRGGRCGSGPLSTRGRGRYDRVRPGSGSTGWWVVTAMSARALRRTDGSEERRSGGRPPSTDTTAGAVATTFSRRPRSSRRSMCSEPSTQCTEADPRTWAHRRVAGDEGGDRTGAPIEAVVAAEDEAGLLHLGGQGGRDVCAGSFGVDVDPHHLGGPRLESLAQDAVALGSPGGDRPHRHVLGFSDPKGQFERGLVAGREAPMGVVGDDAGQGIGLGPQVDPLEEGGDEGPAPRQELRMTTPWPPSG